LSPLRDDSSNPDSPEVIPNTPHHHAGQRCDRRRDYQPSASMRSAMASMGLGPEVTGIL